MVRAANSIEVSRPPKMSFDYLLAFARWPEWALRVVVARYDPPDLTIVNQLFGRTVTTTYSVTDCEAPRLFRFETHDGPVPARFTFEVTTEVGGVTRVTETVDMWPRGPLRLLGPLIGFGAKRQLRANHQVLKYRLERDNQKPSAS